MTTLTSSAGGPFAAAGGRNAISLLEPPASGPPPAQRGKEPPGSPSARPFAAVLDDNQARTAVAEGHETPPIVAQDGDDEREPRSHAGQTDSSSPDGPAVAALLGGVPLAADVAVRAAPVVAAGRAVEPEPGGGRVDVVPPTQAFREQARGIVLTRATRPIGVPADATSLPLRPTAVGAAAGVGADGRGSVAGAPALAAAAPGAAAARATRLADVLQAAVRPGAGASAEQAAPPSPATVAGAAGRGQGGPGGDASPQPAPLAATPATPQAAPLAPTLHAGASAPAEAAGPGRAVGLEHAVETVRLALRAGAERGVTHARISLTPRELGTIEVHLRQTADGLVARVVAEHASAAQQLQQAGTDLRRQLEQSGINVLQLDIGASGEQGGQAAGRQAFGAFGDGDDGRAGRGTSDDDDPLAALDGADDTTPTTTLALPNGALVDVLA